MKNIAYHNDPKFKRNFVKMTRLHRKQDRYISGIYAEGSGESFKGCSVGCSVRSLNLLGLNGMEHNDHAKLADALGWPEWLCLLQDTIFEGLPDKESALWTERLASAVQVGVDLNPVRWKFSVFLLKENIERALRLAIDDELKEKVVGSIRQCMAVNESAILTGVWDESAAWSAESAAWSAANAARSATWSAESAARSATWSADSAARSAESAARSAARSATWSATWSAESAARSAEIAAWSAESADSTARSAAWRAAYICYAKELLRLIKLQK